ncbi:MAG TPA: 50S ribosomal protein L10 [Solirubrobacteraceae bacterium]
MNKEQKAAVVEELAEQIRGADAIFAVDYRGISVSEIADLRSRLRDAETRFRIVKNSLTERASDQAGAEALKELLEGPTAFAFVAGDAALAAKALNDAARTLGTLEFKGGLMDGATLTADEIRSLARLPAREVLHAQLVGTIASPLSGLVRTLNALISGIAVQLGQIAEKGLVSGEAPASAEAPPAEEAPPSAEEAPASTEPDAGDAAAVEGEGSRPDSQEAGASPEAEESDAGSEDATASEAVAPEAEAEQSEPEAQAASEAEPSAEQADKTETEASAEEPQAEEPKEEA